MRWYFSFFVASGFCALVYEVIWLRLAMASFGVTAALVSIVLSIFMAGLGLGAWLTGLLMRKHLAPAFALRLYGLAELLIGISCLAVPYELKLGRSLLLSGAGGVWQSSNYYLLAGVWIAVTLIPWCACMGSTFPLLMAVMRAQCPRADSQRTFSYLYLANVLGAAAGTLASAFVLIELLGFTKTLLVAGSLNAVLAVSAVILSFLVAARKRKCRCGDPCFRPPRDRRDVARQHSRSVIHQRTREHGHGSCLDPATHAVLGKRSLCFLRNSRGVSARHLHRFSRLPIVDTFASDRR